MLVKRLCSLRHAAPGQGTTLRRDEWLHGEVCLHSSSSSGHRFTLSSLTGNCGGEFEQLG